MASHPASTRAYRPPESDSGTLAKVVALLLGILVAVLGFFALLMWVDARDARESADAAAGPTLDTNFHIVGSIFDRAWVNGDMTRFQSGVQTVGVPAGGGAVFDVKIDEPGLYPFVSHAFAHVDLGQVGLLKVGDPKGTATH
ncbi:MAG: hypothetical protein WD380_07950 [Gaiellaceae bacterium]